MDVFLPPDARALRRRSASTSSAARRCSRLPATAQRRCSAVLNGAAPAADDRPQRFRRGVFLLPSLFTVANLFCGYACVVYATRADFDTAALLIGIAMVLDTLDGFFARLTNSSSAFGVAARLARRRRVVRPRAGDPGVHLGPVAAQPARLGRRASSTSPRPRCGSRASTSRRRRSTDKRYFVGMPSPAAAGGDRLDGLPVSRRACRTAQAALPALAMVARAGAPDGQHDPLPQRQGDRRRLAPLLLRAVLRRGGARADRVAPAPRARR